MTGQAGDTTEVISPASIEAGVAVLRRHFGGETEGDNRFVDFREVITEVAAALSGARP